MNQVRIIAEAGVNHNGDANRALAMVDAAAAAGADMVKFQTFTAKTLVSANAPKADYQINATDADSQYAMLRRLEIDRDVHVALMKRCAARGIAFLSSPFDLTSLDMLADLKLTCLKIPSGEIDNLPYLRRAAGLFREIILSTGMATLGEIEAALRILTDTGISLDDIVVLHCTTEYPAPLTDVNLRAMETLRRAFGVRVGYSDHTSGIEVAVAAVALGAEIIEKHFTLNKMLPGPDHQASLDPSELAALVAAVANVTAALGSPVKAPAASELRNRPVVRKGIKAGRAIAAGEPFSADNLVVLRPQTGLSPLAWDILIGRPAPRDFAAGEPIGLDMPCVPSAS
ncbi:MAG: N-acetylneuraminate synthase [Desulfovibrio sp.]